MVSASMNSVSYIEASRTVYTKVQPKQENLTQYLFEDATTAMPHATFRYILGTLSCTNKPSASRYIHLHVNYHLPPCR